MIQTAQREPPRPTAPPTKANTRFSPLTPERPVNEVPTRIDPANAINTVASHFTVSRRFSLARTYDCPDDPIAVSFIVFCYPDFEIKFVGVPVLEQPHDLSHWNRLSIPPK